MILDEIEVKERLESPLNLLNRLKTITNTHKPNSNIIPSLPPSSAEIIDNLNEKLAFGSIKSKAAGIMSEVLDELKLRLPEVKVDKLAGVAESMNKIVTAQTESKRSDEQKQFVIFAPSFVQEDHFDTIYARE